MVNPITLTKLEKNAQKLKTMGVRIIAIGAVHDLQNDVNNREIWQELQDIASSQADVKMIDFAQWRSQTIIWGGGQTNAEGVRSSMVVRGHAPRENFEI